MVCTSYAREELQFILHAMQYYDVYTCRRILSFAEVHSHAEHGPSERNHSTVSSVILEIK